MTDFEKMVTALLNGESVDLEPNCRCEEYLKACIEGTGTDSLPTPRSRMDILLWQLAEKASSGWGGGEEDNSWEITWDGNTEGLEMIPGELLGGFSLYRVMDTVPDSMEESIIANGPAMIELSVSGVHPETGEYVSMPAESGPIPRWVPMEGPDGTPIMWATAMGSGPCVAAFVRDTFEIADGLTLFRGLYLLYVLYDGYAMHTSRIWSPVTCKENALLAKTITEVYDDTVMSLSPYTFSNCRSLITVNLPVCNSVGEYAFYQCNKLTTVNVRYNFKSIPSNCFYRCYALTDIPSMTNVTSLSASAFSECNSIKSVPLASRVQTIPSNAFYRCRSLENIGTPTLTTIGQSGFNECESLPNIDLSKVTTIDDMAFQQCLGFTEIDLSSVTSLGSGVFTRCSNLVTVVPPNVTSLPNATFHSCSSLKNIDASKFTGIGEYAFYQCMSLESVDLSSAVAIGQYAFNGCSNLATVVMPNVTSIGANAFQNCKILRRVDIHATVSIGAKAFSMDGGMENGLRLLVLRSETMSTLKSWDALANSASAYNLKILVPSALIDAYKTDTNWRSWAGMILPLENYTVDGTITGELDESKV
jgi:hypothetical protein